MPLRFSKYHGLGNDFILLDCRDLSTPLTPERIRSLCHRHKGIGADGILVREASDVADQRMVLHNADGKPAEISGNGLRCFAMYVHERGEGNDGELSVETGGGVLRAWVRGERDVETTMPAPAALRQAWESGTRPKLVQLYAEGMPFSVLPVNVGNPHGVIFGPARDIPFAGKYGPSLEHDALFPEGANIQFAHLVSPIVVELVVWERGSGVTLACGSGSVATACAGCSAGLLRFDTPIAVKMPGGTLTITVGGGFAWIRQRGEVMKVYEGVCNL
ncbi:diaminopimelate epimerase [candidate division KSB1 bacterium]|nr:diaminopimelate epimerase [candidate division KSB1 bacterium]